MRLFTLAIVLLFVSHAGQAQDRGAAGGGAAYRSHPPMRPLPQAVEFALAAGPKRFVDPARGDDAAN